ncbi:MAG TPA: signal peptidase II [Kofleriaceae bacterium]|jgi:signal peptidase II|nr:signal peptidase II [Kofleriaceae bacterium]
MTARRGAVVFAVILIATLALDQGSKAWAHTLPVWPAGCAQPEELLAFRCAGMPQPVIEGYWDWELAYNPGVAFSTFTSFGGRTGMQVILSLIAALALVGISVMAMRTAPEERWKRGAFALIAGGALGNLVDRVRDGAVTDFVRWRIHDHRWPIFNIADAALLVGVAVLLYDGMRARRRLRTA